MKPRYFLIHLLATPLFAGNFFSATAGAAKTSENSSIEQMNLQNTLQPTSASATVSEGWTLDTSLLYWNAKSDGFGFGQKANRIIIRDSTGASIANKATFKNETLPFNSWDPGVQVGLGYIFPQREQWVTRLGWTHLNTDSSKSVSTNDISEAPFVTSLAPFLLGSFAFKASADWHLHYNILDADIGRPFFVGKWLALKPLIGLRGGWIHQRFKTDYNGAFEVNTTQILPLDTSFHSKQELGGIGLRIGSDAKFFMGECWSLLGNLSTSLLWTSIELKQKIAGFNFESKGAIAKPLTISSKDTYEKLRANLEGQLGVQWQTFYHNDHFRFAISALYTFSYWFGLNQLTNQVIDSPQTPLTQGTVIPLTSNGDLQLQGANIKFDFDF